MRKLFAIAAITILTASSAIAADPINPLTGEPMKQPLAKPKAELKADSKTPTTPMGMQNPYIPAPSYNQPYTPPQQRPAFDKDKDQPVDKDIKPEDRFVIDGIVNSNIVIIDRMNEDKYIQVNDMSVLDNGCLVKYPSILCGDHAKKALKLNEDKDELSQKVLSLTRENASLRTKGIENSTKINKNLNAIAAYELKIKDLEAKTKDLEAKASTFHGLNQKLTETTTATIHNLNQKLSASTATTTSQGIKISTIAAKLEVCDKTLSEKQKAEIIFNANKKSSDTEIVALKKAHEAEISALKRSRDTELATITKTNTEATTLTKKNNDIAIFTLKKSYNTELSILKKANTESTTLIRSIEPKLVILQSELNTAKAIVKESMQDMSMLTDILYKSQLGTDYNIPKIGKFKGVLHENLIYAFVPLESKQKADTYLKSTMLRAYKTDKYILYINSKKLIE